MVAGLSLLLVAAPAGAQNREASSSLESVVHQLQDQVRELRQAVAEMRAEAAQYSAETAELRRELQATRKQMAASRSGEQAEAAVASDKSTSIATRVAALEESSQLQDRKLDDQYQTKVESASRYRVRLSGMVLLNVFSNHGAFDNSDFPNYAPEPSPFNSGATLGASLRQSELGLEVFGPRLAGARASGNLQVDFAGGFPAALNGSSFGVLRLRTASMRLDWDRTSLLVGQNDVFVSPQSPTSFASLAVPAFGYQGNLWGWVPQIRLEHRFALPGGQTLVLQGGLLDNLSGEPPFVSYDRLQQAGERSGQPAYGFRAGWSRRLAGQVMTVGAAGFYSRQNWGFERHVDGWAGMVDWEVPLARRLSLSGEFYRGRAIGGLGGGIGRSTLYSGSIYDPATRIIGLDSVGGWSELKFRATPKLEFNGAFGLDNPYAEDVRAFPVTVSYFEPTLTQNRSGFVNFVYRPKSNLLFSTEYRRLRTFAIDRNSQSAGQMNLIMGVLF
jgi:regulator of replication initiation timing